MKRAAIVLVALLGACSKKEDPSTSSATPSASVTGDPSKREGTSLDAEGSGPQSAPERPADAVVLSISVNGSIDAEVVAGRPMVVVVDAPSDATLEVLDGSGAKLDWPLKRLRANTWSFAETASLPRGAYRLRATAGGSIDESRVRIVDAPSSPTSEEEAEALLARLASGEREGALKAAEDRLAKSPKDVLALCVKGDALAALGRNAEAVESYRRAIREWSRTQKEPPRTLLRRLASAQPGFEE